MPIWHIWPCRCHWSAAFPPKSHSPSCGSPAWPVMPSNAAWIRGFQSQGQTHRQLHYLGNDAPQPAQLWCYVCHVFFGLIWFYLCSYVLFVDFLRCIIYIVGLIYLEILECRTMEPIGLCLRPLQACTCCHRLMHNASNSSWHPPATNNMVYMILFF